MSKVDHKPSLSPSNDLYWLRQSRTRSASYLFCPRNRWINLAIKLPDHYWKKGLAFPFFRPSPNLANMFIFPTLTDTDRLTIGVEIAYLPIPKGRGNCPQIRHVFVDLLNFPEWGKVLGTRSRASFAYRWIFHSLPLGAQELADLFAFVI